MFKESFNLKVDLLCFEINFTCDNHIQDVWMCLCNVCKGSLQCPGGKITSILPPEPGRGGGGVGGETRGAAHRVVALRGGSYTVVQLYMKVRQVQDLGLVGEGVPGGGGGRGVGGSQVERGDVQGPAGGL